MPRSAPVNFRRMRLELAQWVGKRTLSSLPVRGGRLSAGAPEPHTHNDLGHEWLCSGHGCSEAKRAQGTQSGMGASAQAERALWASLATPPSQHEDARGHSVRTQLSPQREGSCQLRCVKWQESTRLLCQQSRPRDTAESLSAALKQWNPPGPPSIKSATSVKGP